MRVVAGQPSFSFGLFLILHFVEVAEAAGADQCQ
jgi:hypothetical protein